MDWSQLWTAADKLGVVGLLLFLAFAGYHRWWVFGWAYMEAVADRDKYKKWWVEAINRQDRTMDVVEHSIGQPKPLRRLRAVSQVRTRRQTP